MTTASPTDPTVRYGDRITQRANSARPAGQTDWSERNGVVELIGDQVSDLAKVVGDHIAELQTDVEQRVDRRLKALELQLAETRGAVDILRGKGQPGTFSIRGTFDARAVYNFLDVVAYNGASWVATRDNPGREVPGPGWQLLAAQGSRGVRGEKGERGPAGPSPVFMGASFSMRGMELETSAGAISLFKSVAVDPQTFTIRFTGVNDTSLTLNLLPLFREYDAQKKGA
jgi:hypothetical protein